MTRQAPDTATTFAVSDGYRKYVLFILFIIYGLSYVDRQIFFTLIEPIRKEFEFGDFQMGLLSGMAFAMFYATLGIPIARFADRHNRVNIISVSLVVWSAATALTAKAMGFWHLFLARVSVGVGEAGCNPSAYSIISDYFPAKKRATAQSIYSLGVYLGQFIGFLTAGYVAQEYGWRTAFYVVGLPGLAVAIVAKLTLREPPRGFSEPAGFVLGEPPKLLYVLKKLFSLPAFRNLSVAAGLHALVAYGLQSYYSAFLMRVHGMSLAETSAALAVITVTGGLTGTYLGGKLSDVLSQRRGGDPRYQMWVPAAALLINIPAWLFALLLPSKYASMALMIPSIALGATYLGPSIAATHQLARVPERAVSGAVLLFVLNFIGIGFGPMLTGAISDWLRDSYVSGGMELEAARALGLKYALCIMSLSNLWSAYHYFRAAKTLREDIATGQAPVAVPVHG
ncbi:MAG TPA: MFS transporter, partial [Steroidobacteraceae bacterium]